MSKKTTAMLLLPALLASGMACAQTAAPVVQKPQAPRLPPPAYVSVFDNYQPYRDEKPRDWREVNRQVDLRGGWRQYAKEAQAPEAVADTPTPRADAQVQRAAPPTKP